MQIAVLVKVVPPVDQVRYDPDRKTMVREGTALYVNPFDQRALRVALDIRRSGEKVTVISMGPPAAEPLLRESLALGADEAILVTDRRLAGSDTLVTSRALARAISRVGHDLVVAGDWSVDSETGQVGPEVAGLLGVAVYTGARSLLREPAGDGLEATVETESGRARLRFRPPAVITVGEKIARIRKPTVEEARAADSRGVVRWTLDDLGLTEEEAGLIGSPTVVVTLRNEEPARKPRVFGEGPLKERVRQAVEVLRTLLAGPFAPAAPTTALLGPRVDSKEVLVLSSGPHGEVRAEALPLLSEVRRSLPGYLPAAVVVGPATAASHAEEISRAGAVHGYRLPAPSPVSSRTAAVAFEALLAHRPRTAAALFPSDGFGREVAGQLAARLHLGLTGDAISVRAEPDGTILWGKPAFGGGVVADILSRTRPSLATVRAGAFASAPSGQVSDPKLRWEEVDLTPVPVDFELLEETRELPTGVPALGEARVVLSVGMGIGGPERLPAVWESAARLGAAVGGTRRVIDAGWLPRQLQIGLTGRSVAPALGILVGVNGATNHLIGFRRARALLGINHQPDAPLFRGVDVGIVGPWDETLDLVSASLVPEVRGWAPG